MPESSMKTRDVHAHLKKSGWALKRTGGGHDVYSHPKSKEHIAVPRHK
jgi:predicted RNA binding protein YcfA (HicA-like mRNA interferase family)